MAKLIEQRYGKVQVRMLKILREGLLHTIREIVVSGRFRELLHCRDNSKVVPTDTIRNTMTCSPSSTWRITWSGSRPASANCGGLGLFPPSCSTTINWLLAGPTPPPAPNLSQASVHAPIGLDIEAD